MKSLILAAAIRIAVGAAIEPAATADHPNPYLPIAEEAAPRLIVDPPVAHRLAHGAVVIPYRTENFRILPVFGTAALGISPRAGHLHVTVDSLPWHWADAGNTGAVVVVGLPPGPHQVLIELAAPDHHVLTGETVSFRIPAAAGD